MYIRVISGTDTVAPLIRFMFAKSIFAIFAVVATIAAAAPAADVEPYICESEVLAFKPAKCADGSAPVLVGMNEWACCKPKPPRCPRKMCAEAMPVCEEGEEAELRGRCWRCCTINY
ncbi:hypothetical protein HGRIS_014325 [Hohenbuehelia grisea]|uniref:Single domain-containing protein n=1 Tax=Hohenbuehelia grisea TaxID=104357 RepID=A0ABR3JT60_9AGAR